MSEYIIQDGTMKYIADAVREKAGLADDMSPMRIASEIYLLETETDTGAPSNGVQFYDYDGTLLYSYTVKEARALTALPKGPEREGLTFAGWTHSLDEVNATMKCLHVGAMYESVSSKFTFQLTSALTITLAFYQSVSHGVLINWGDGSTTETIDGVGDVKASHDFAAGTFVIDMSVTAGELQLGRNAGSMLSDGTSPLFIKKAIIGTGVTFRGTHTFHNFHIESIIIPRGLTSIPQKTFQNASYLKFCVIPNTVTTISSYAFDNAFLSGGIVIPESVITVGQTLFRYCTFKRIIVPSKLSLGQSMFYSCASLKQCYIRKADASVSIVNGTFEKTNATPTIYVPITNVDEYKARFASVASQIKGEPIPMKF